jgi:acetate kinase
MIVEQLDFLGFSLDADKNIDGRIDVSILRINSDDDKQIYVILTDEQLELALSLEQAITIETNN